MSTPQQVITQPTEEPRAVIEVTTAGFFERIGAAIIDLGLPYGLGVLTLLLWPEPPVMEASQWNAIDRFIDGYNVDPSLVWSPVTVIAMSAFAWNLVHGMKGIEPFGRRLLKLKLVNKAGQTPTHKEIALHCGSRLISALTLMLGHLWLLADPEKRTFHDRVAGLYLVHEKTRVQGTRSSEPEETQSGPETSL